MGWIKDQLKVTAESELVGLHFEPAILGLYKQMFLCALAHMTSTWPSSHPYVAKLTVSFGKIIVLWLAHESVPSNLKLRRDSNSLGEGGTFPKPIDKGVG